MKTANISDLLKQVTPGNQYCIMVNGQSAVDNARKIIGSRCYLPVEINGKFAFQIEVVIDEPGTYNNRPNKWVSFGFIPSETVETVVVWLKDNGFFGYATLQKEDSQTSDYVENNPVYPFIIKEKRNNTMKKQEVKTTFTDKAKKAFWTAYEKIVVNGEYVPVYFSENNGKTHMPTIDLLPLLTCHGRCRGLCGKIEKGKCLPPCYAAKFCNRLPEVMKHYAENTVLAIYRPEQYWTEIRTKMKVSRFMRLFGSGDMIISGYFDNLCKALQDNPHCHIQGFTKCYEIVNRYISENGKLPDNLHILFSGWYEYLPINPNNLPESRVFDDELPEGWLGCCENCLGCCCIGTGCWKAGTGEIVGLKKH